MVIVDATVWIDYLRLVDSPQALWLDRHVDSIRLGLTDLSLCEILQGTRNPNDFREVRTDLLRFRIYETGGAEIAIAAAKNYLSLRERGHTVRKTTDCLIATFCIRHGHELLHSDRDFDPFEEALGLKVVHAS
jgi:predicted nucleic acid-binding protein